MTNPEAEEPIIPDKLNAGDMIIATIVRLIIPSIIFLIGAFGLYRGGVISLWSSDMMISIRLLALVLIIFSSLAIAGIVAYTYADISEYKKEINEYKLKLEKYQKYNDRIQMESEWINKSKSELEEARFWIERENSSLESILKKAYDLKIIPLLFCNIEGVYFLYDYLSTSSESLNSTLFQAIFESTRNQSQKIELQRSMIIQQVKENSTFFEQSEKKLKTMKNVEQYSKISAINSEIVAKLNVKQLAYQQKEQFVQIIDKLKEIIWKNRVVGDIIKFGKYTWRVLDKAEHSALIITEDIVENREYNEEETDITWEKCTLRNYLNNEFYNTFSEGEKAMIAETNVINKHNSKGGNDTKDKIFLLSIDEANIFFLSNNDRVAKNYYGKASWWWLRSPGYCQTYAAYVDYDGSVCDSGCGVRSDGGIRPALYFKF